MDLNILILGDVGASKYNEQDFCKSNESLFSKEIVKICENADIVLVNLEKPLIDIITPLGLCPPDYAAPTETINGILMLNPTAVTLANNHIMDQREQGLRSTIEILERHNIQYVGVGENSYLARSPIIIDRKGMKIGVYACCEKEFSFATESNAGANVFDPLESLDDISSLKEKCDHLIVLYHGGMQDYPYPTPYQQKVCRKMCEKGADLVVCQHSHIIGCQERFQDSFIIYGQGNFLLDEKPNDINWKNGLIVENYFEKGQWFTKYIPVQTLDHRVILHKDSDYILASFLRRSNEILNDSFINTQFNNLSRKMLSKYLIKLSGTRRFMQRVLRRLRVEVFFSNILYGKKERNIVLDYLYCDSHREAIINGLENDSSYKE